jgi:hypothetical protein
VKRPSARSVGRSFADCRGFLSLRLGSLSILGFEQRGDAFRVDKRHAIDLARLKRPIRTPALDRAARDFEGLGELILDVIIRIARG